MSILKRGMKGAPVKRLQEKLGIDADGDYGSGTEKAVRAFQEEHGLSADGIAGPDTFTAMGLPELVLLRVGSRGETVKKLQAALGVDADGIFGNGTKKAVMDYQTSHGLAADGMAGPATLAQMSAFAGEVTEEAVKRAFLTTDEEEFESEPLPELKAGEIIKGSLSEPAPEKSVWSKVKGWFS